MFNCDLCKTLGFTTIGGLARHKSIHMAFKFPCPCCDMLYRYKKTLMKHIVNCHRDCLPINEENIKPVFSPDSMVRYTNTLCNYGKEVWTCKNCLKILLSESASKEHVISCALEQKNIESSKTMNSVKPELFTCHCCNYTFRRKIAFDRHMQQMKIKKSLSDDEVDE